MNEVVELQRQLQGAGYIAERCARGGAAADARPRPSAAAGGRRRRRQDRGRQGARHGARRAGSSACSATKGSTCTRRCTNGTTSGSCWRSSCSSTTSARRAVKEQDIFSERYLLKRPLLEAISCAEPPVLLIDEVDRADEAFEAYLLELLSDFQMSIPELGTVRARFAAARGHHLERHARAVRRAAPPLPVSVHRLSRLREGAGDRRDQGAGGGRTSSRARWSSSCRACAAWTCRRSRASPRRSTGRRRCCAWAFRRIDDDGAERILETLSALIKTRDDRAGFTREVVARIAAAC